MVSTRWLFTLLLGLALCACGSEDSTPQGPATVTSQDGRFRAAFTPEPDPPVVGENALGIALSDPGGAPVVGAAIEVEPWMPAHGHGSSTEPEVSELGEGKYRAEHVTLTMPGQWELRIGVTAEHVHDSFKLVFDVK